MEAIERRIREVLNELRQEVDCEFCALAVIDRRERHTCWRWASGNLNERYLNIRTRHGQGIEGEIIKVGRGLSWYRKGSKEANILASSSILLTEKLESAYAVPVMAERTISGILLVGDRSPRDYDAAVREIVWLTGAGIAGFLDDLI
ncbi:GAF domain-containing protein [Cohnella mopanensis]|uniref:GAF domain-containing protein n=1 Tax=Cohnella mopanensis TaxID=2911966 RepID=UPI001EF9296A|nr:GAF domain-containing protein [Cohnella mopanensis]